VIAPSEAAFVHDPACGLRGDGVPLAEIAARAGTPTYVYSAASIRAAWTRLDAAFATVPHALHYALKANSTLGVLRLLRSLGSRADANSGGEIEIALRAGFIPDDMVFTGVGKTPEELQLAVSLGVRVINAESPGELERIEAVALAQGRRARVAVRVNPDIAAGTHPHISTGQRFNKFGMPIGMMRDLYRHLAQRAGVVPVGLHVHIGSQITDLEPLKKAAAAVVELAGQLAADGIGLEHVDLGGGLGIPYDGGAAPGIEDYAAAILPIVRGTGLTLLLEPGRIVVGPAGVLLARVVDIKSHFGQKHFVVLDAGMTELLRPAMYGAFHRIEPVAPRAGAAATVDIVGPLCESSDTLGSDRTLPPLEVGDLVAVLDAGAYGSAMASTYNRRPLPCEVMIDGDRWEIIRRRQTIDEMIGNEI
jgi:diaminopimelate decarboxylase